MGKTSRKTKAKKKDFNKVKLKVGKQKPKANNATDVSFKSQSIYIPDQLKNGDNQNELSLGKKTLSNLLAELNHPSPSTRVQALQGLKELLAANSSNFDYTKTLEKGIKLILDEQNLVRKHFTSLLALIFCYVDPLQMKPHFNFILKHLFCAMSHLDRHIQKDSLQVVDLFLKFFPNLLEEPDCKRLIESFIDMISTEKESKGQRILAINLSKQETSVSWRIGVLKRIDKLIDVVCKTEVYDKQYSTRTLHWDDTGIGNTLIHNLQQQGVLLEHYNFSIAKSSGADNITELLKSTIPLMLQCWMEVWSEGPVVCSDDNQVISTMVHAVNIIHKICYNLIKKDKNEKTLLSKSHSDAFNKYLFNKFPFEQSILWENEAMKRKSKNKPVEGHDVIDLNICLCNLATLFCDVTQSNENQRFYLKVIDFIGKTLEGAQSSGSLHIGSRFEKIMKSLEDVMLLSNYDREKTFTIVFWYYKGLHAKHVNKEKLTGFYHKLFEDSDAVTIFNDVVSTLCGQLIDLLTEMFKQRPSVCQFSKSSRLPMSVNAVLGFMKTGIAKKNLTLVKSINNHVGNIFEILVLNGHSLFCTDDSCFNCLTFQNQLLECTIAANGVQLTPMLIDSMEKLCKLPWLSVKTVSYIVEILFCKINSVCCLEDSSRADEMVSICRLPINVMFERSVDDDTTALVNHERLCKHIMMLIYQSAGEYKDLKHILIDFARLKIKNCNGPNQWIALLQLAHHFHKPSNPEFDFSILFDQVPGNTESFAELVKSPYFAKIEANLKSVKILGK